MKIYNVIKTMENVTLADLLQSYELTASEIVVLLSIISKSESGTCEAAMRDLVSFTRLSDPTIRKAKIRLAEVGLISITERYGEFDERLTDAITVNIRCISL